MKYRRDIQILRGLAVSFIVVFHLWPNLSPAGYIGVDVFFVISGFLMAVLYNKEGAENPVIEFYTRRFHRILPAYFLTIMLTMVVGSFIFLPHEFNALRSQSLWAFGFFPNVYYLISGESYFDKVAFRPLLHTWSLGVEIQFYLLVPFFHWIYRRSLVFGWIVLLASFVSCILITGISAKLSFFSLPFRVWEFLIGFYLALKFSDRGAVVRQKPLIGISAALLLVGLAMVKSETNSHPGILALIAALSTAVVIAYGLPRFVKSGFLGRGLEVVGNYSYSVYLLHYPLIIFLYYQPFHNMPSNIALNADLVIYGLLLLIGSYLSYNYVERNRLSQLLKINRTLFICIIAALFAPLYFLSGGMAENMHDIETRNISLSLEDRGGWRCGKWASLLRIVSDQNKLCLLSGDQKNNAERLLLIGDSSADAFKVSISNIASRNSANLFLTVENCNLGYHDCGIDSVIGLVNEHGINKVVLHDFYRNFSARDIEHLLQSLEKRELDIAVYYIMPIPNWPGSVPEFLLKRKRGDIHLSGFYADVEYFNDIYAHIHEELGELAERYKIDLIPTLESFCNPECLWADTKSRPYYFDSIHLTLTGAEILEPVLEHYLFDRNR